MSNPKKSENLKGQSPKIPKNPKSKTPGNPIFKLLLFSDLTELILRGARVQGYIEHRAGE